MQPNKVVPRDTVGGRVCLIFRELEIMFPPDTVKMSFLAFFCVGKIQSPCGRNPGERKLTENKHIGTGTVFAYDQVL